MKLIDADGLLERTKFYNLKNGNRAIDEIDILHAPTVKAIPIERLEQIREEIESNKNTTSMLDCAKFYNNGLDKALEILDKLIAESESQKNEVEDDKRRKNRNS